MYTFHIVLTQGIGCKCRTHMNRNTYVGIEIRGLDSISVHRTRQSQEKARQGIKDFNIFPTSHWLDTAPFLFFSTHTTYYTAELTIYFSPLPYFMLQSSALTLLSSSLSMSKHLNSQIGTQIIFICHSGSCPSLVTTYNLLLTHSQRATATGFT